MNAFAGTMNIFAQAMERNEQPVMSDFDIDTYELPTRWVTPCAMYDCENDLNDVPGMEIIYKSAGKRCIERICMDCFNDPEYQKELKINHPEAIVREYK